MLNKVVNKTKYDSPNNLLKNAFYILNKYMHFYIYKITT